MNQHPLSGVYAAALTPLTPDFNPDYEAIPRFLAFLAGRGCHGALLLGTTGEGPSFSCEERLAIFRAALTVRQEYPAFRLLAGTGTPSLTETITLTKAAFDLGFEGVVTLPPYYFHKAGDEGLFLWFERVLRAAVPGDGWLFGYHFPAVSGVALSLDLLAKLRDAHPSRFAGIKDSSGDPEHAARLGARFGRDLAVLTGSDSLLSHALAHGAAGCITAMANLFSPDLRRVWEAHLAGQAEPEAQARLNARRTVLSAYQPYAASIKALLPRFAGFPQWAVRPPLLPLPPEAVAEAARAFREI